MNAEFNFVLCVGLSRTGTMSLKAALETILPGKCHHFIDAVNHDNEWDRIFRGMASDQEFKHFFLDNGYSAATDFPFLSFKERALKLFPQAKVILTTREPSTWVKSMKATVVPTVKIFDAFPYYLFKKIRCFQSYLEYCPTLIPNLKRDETFMGMISAVENNEGEIFFNQWVAHIKSQVSEKRLLVFNPHDGWDPLCKFFNVPAPGCDFPVINTMESYKLLISSSKRNRSWLLLYEALSISTFTVLLLLFN